MSAPQQPIPVVTAAQAVDLLNQLYALDPRTMSRLVKYRALCNRALADHPTVQVLKQRHGYYVGMIGVLNGIFGSRPDGLGFIAAKFDDDTQRLLGFCLTRNPQP